MRRALASVLLVIAAAGCDGGGVVAGEGHFEGLTTQELPLRVRITNVVGNWAQFSVLAGVEAPSAEWAALEVEPDEPALAPASGPAGRTVDGVVELERGAAWFRPDLCESAVCEIDLLIRLDSVPTAPWSASVFATVDGDTQGEATIEITERAAP